MLRLLDPRLELRFNSKLQRYEVWNSSGFIQRVVAPDGGFAQPGEWLINQLRRKDPAHNSDLDDIVKQYAAPLDQENEASTEAATAPLLEHASEVAHEYAPIFKREMTDDPIAMKPFRIGGKE